MVTRQNAVVSGANCQWHFLVGLDILDLTYGFYIMGHGS